MLRSSLVIAAVAFVLVAAGCGSGSGSGGGSKAAVNPNTAETSPAGDIPDNQAYVAYTPPGGGYSVKVPEGWARTAAGGAVTFTDKLNSIRMESAAAKAAPTVAGTKSAAVPQLGQAVKGFKAGGVSSVSRKAGTAIRIKYLSDAPADPVTGKTRQNAVERYVFFHNGKDVILTLSGPKGADNVDPWKIVTDSVRWSG
jgi:hypothetical protein